MSNSTKTSYIADESFEFNFTPSEPAYNMIFTNDEYGEVGKLTWGSGKFEFTGEMEKHSNEIFKEY